AMERKAHGAKSRQNRSDAEAHERARSKYERTAAVCKENASSVGALSTNRSVVSDVGSKGGSVSLARRRASPNTRSEPSRALATSKQKTSSASTTIPVSSWSSRTAAACQASPKST